MPDFREYAHGQGTAMFLAHSGKGHDDNPPGRGSGSNPYQRNNEKYYAKVNKLNRIYNEMKKRDYF